MSDIDPSPSPTPDYLENLRKVVLAGYALQAAGFFTGGLGFVVAIVVAYIKREDARGTPYESHLNWQINTFWAALLMSVPATILAFITLGLLAAPVFFALFIWSIYRIAKGWLALNDGKSPYLQTSPQNS